MARTGLAQIDALLEGQPSQPLAAGNATSETVGFLQDLLIGHGFKGIPGPLGTARGTFGPRTTEAIKEFQRLRGLTVTGSVDRPTLQAFIEHEWSRPIACCGYLACVLDLDFAGMVRLVSITSQFEGAGLFTALNRNTDRAGLSFGLIQWAQKPLRLNELLRAFQTREPSLYIQIFGGGDVAVAQGLIAHTAKARGGTDETGATVDPRYDLIRDPWDKRFIDAGKHKVLQRVQLDLASADFLKSFGRIQASAPQIRSERGIAFMLDVANQHGDGGALSILRQVAKAEMSESDLLAAIQQESVARVRAQFGDGPEFESTLNRRQAFRTTTLLSEERVMLA